MERSRSIQAIRACIMISRLPGGVLCLVGGEKGAIDIGSSSVVLVFELARRSLLPSGRMKGSVDIGDSDWYIGL
jgi:hypothetical protein